MSVTCHPDKNISGSESQEQFLLTLTNVDSSVVLEGEDYDLKARIKDEANRRAVFLRVRLSELLNVWSNVLFLIVISRPHSPMRNHGRL